MNDQRSNNRPVDPYEEQYRRQLEQFSRMAGEDGGEVGLQPGSIDDAFAGEYPDDYGAEQSYEQTYSGGGSQPADRPRKKRGSSGRTRSSSSRPAKKHSGSSGSSGH